MAGNLSTQDEVVSINRWRCHNCNEFFHAETPVPVDNGEFQCVLCKNIGFVEFLNPEDSSNNVSHNSNSSSTFVSNEPELYRFNTGVSGFHTRDLTQFPQLFQNIASNIAGVFDGGGSEDIPSDIQEVSNSSVESSDLIVEENISDNVSTRSLLYSILRAIILHTSSRLNTTATTSPFLSNSNRTETPVSPVIRRSTEDRFILLTPQRHTLPHDALLLVSHEHPHDRIRLTRTARSSLGRYINIFDHIGELEDVLRRVGDLITSRAELNPSSAHFLRLRIFPEWLRHGSPPTSAAVLKNLPEFTLNQSGGECVICQDNFAKGDVVTRLTMNDSDCSHQFHSKCILPWLKERNSCPVCRFELPTDNEEYERLKRRPR